MPMLNDKTCANCGQELEWVGSFRDGHMACTNMFCKDKDAPKLPDDYVEELSTKRDFGGTSPDASAWIAYPSGNMTRDEILIRWVTELATHKVHRVWCRIKNPIDQSISVCDCGLDNPCPYSDSLIETLERRYHGDTKP